MGPCEIGRFAWWDEIRPSTVGRNPSQHSPAHTLSSGEFGTIALMACTATYGPPDASPYRYMGIYYIYLSVLSTCKRARFEHTLSSFRLTARHVLPASTTTAFAPTSTARTPTTTTSTAPALYSTHCPVPSVRRHTTALDIQT